MSNQVNVLLGLKRLAKATKNKSLFKWCCREFDRLAELGPIPLYQPDSVFRGD